MYGILEIAVRVVAALIALVASTYVLPAAKAWLLSKIGEDATKDVISLCQTFVLAAEQMLKTDDPTGEKRKAYVVDQLQKLDILLTDEVNAYIEAFVYQLGHTPKFYVDESAVEPEAE